MVIKLGNYIFCCSNAASHWAPHTHLLRYEKDVYLCVRGRYKDRAREESALFFQWAHMQMRNAVLWEWKALKTADVLKQKKGRCTQQSGRCALYWCFLQEAVHCHKRVLFPRLTPHHFEVLISPPGICKRKKWSSTIGNRSKTILCCSEPEEMNKGCIWRKRQMEFCTVEGAKGEKQALCDSQCSWAIPSSKLSTIYHFITGPDEHTVYFLYQHILGFQGHPWINIQSIQGSRWVFILHQLYV